MRCLVTMFSCDRYGHMRLCLGEWLLKDDLKNCDVAVLDDGSEDPRIRAYLENLAGKGEIEAVFGDPYDGSMEARIGYRRHQAVEIALEKGYDYLLMLDDDVVVGHSTIQEALADAEMLKTTGGGRFKPGALSLHHPHSIISSYVLDGRTFNEAGIGGEANVLLPKEPMEKFGDQWGPHPKGFGDTYFRAVRQAGYRYLSRVNPPYEVQHIGIGVGGSKIHEGKKRQPFWVNRVYENPNVGGPIKIADFDMAMYLEGVRAGGPRIAPEWYLKHGPRRKTCCGGR